jgi:hypothetical protein
MSSGKQLLITRYEVLRIRSSEPCALLLEHSMHSVCLHVWDESKRGEGHSDCSCWPYLSSGFGPGFTRVSERITPGRQEPDMYILSRV